jgi:hypothetical protein
MKNHSVFSDKTIDELLVPKITLRYLVTEEMTDTDGTMYPYCESLTDINITCYADGDEEELHIETDMDHLGVETIDSLVSLLEKAKKDIVERTETQYEKRKKATARRER